MYKDIGLKIPISLKYMQRKRLFIMKNVYL